MIHHWKALNMEITDSQYHHDPTSSCQIIPSQTSNLKHVEITKFQINQHMMHHWRANDLEIIDCEYLSGAAYNIGERLCELKAKEPVSERS